MALRPTTAGRARNAREGANRDMNPGGGGGRGATRPLSAMPQRERPASAHNVMFGRPGVESDRPTSGSGAAPHMKRDTLADASRRAYTLRPGGAGSARAGLNRPASALSGSRSGKQTGTHSLDSRPPRPTSAASMFSRPGSAFSLASGLSQPGLPLDGSRQIAEVGGQLWLGQLMTLMTSINKWPVSLDPKAVARSVCAKACALVQAESAALFLVNEAAERLVMQARFPVQPPDQRPETGAELETVRYGEGCAGTAALEQRAVRSTSEPMVSQPWYHATADQLANRPGLHIAPESLLAVPLCDAAGSMIAILLLAEKKGGTTFSSADESMVSLLGLQATTVLRCCDLHLRSLSDRQGDRDDSPELALKATSSAHTPQDSSDRHALVARNEPPKLLGMSESLKEMLKGLIAGGVRGTDEDIQSMLLNVAGKLSEVVDGHTSVFLQAENGDELWSVVESEGGGAGTRITLPLAADTTAGWCFLNGKPLLVPNIARDGRFVRLPNAIDGEAGRVVGHGVSVTCMPIKSTLGHVVPESGEEVFETLGVVEVISDEPLDARAHEVLRQLAQLLAVTLERMQHQTRSRAISTAAGAIGVCVSRADLQDALHQAVCQCLCAADAGIILSGKKDMLVQEWLETDEHGASVTRREHKPVDDAGLAGYVVKSGDVLNELDLHHIRTPDGTSFDPERDFTYYRQCQELSEVPSSSLAVPLLMVPVRRPDGRIAGVVYAAQKFAMSQRQSRVQARGAYFDASDERGLRTLADEVGRALVRVECHEENAAVCSGQEMMLGCVSEMMSEYDLRRLIRIISRNVCLVTQAEHCSTYMIDHDSEEMWTQVAGLSREIRLPINQGLVGHVATCGDLAVVHSAEQVKGALVGDSSEVVQSILCCPIVGRGKGSPTLAVIQAFHATPNFFSQSLIDMVQRLAKMASVALQNQIMFESKTRVVLRGLPIARERAHLHRELSKTAQDHIGCEAVIIHQLVSPWDVLSSLAPSGSFREASASRGIVGSVATSGNAVLSESAWLLPGFDAEVDQAGSKETQTLLCTPMVDSVGTKVGCVLAINKRKGQFTRQDEAWLKIMSGQIAQILSNHATHEKTVRTRDYYASFLRASRSLGGMTSMHALIPAMETTVKGLLRCSKCTVYTHERENNVLFTLDAAGREHWIGVSDKTVAGWVCLNAKATRIDNVYKDARFNGLISSENSERTCNMVCCPVMRGSHVLGVVQCVRDTAPLFSLVDEDWLVDFTQQVSMAALHTLQENSAAYKVFDLVDAITAVSSVVNDQDTLQINIKNVVRKALACEKVNVYLVDVVRQELVTQGHLAHQDEVDDLNVQAANQEAELLRLEGNKYGEKTEECEAARARLLSLRESIKTALKLQEGKRGMVSRVQFGQGIVGTAAASGGVLNTTQVTKEMQLVEFERYSIHQRPVITMLCTCVHNENGDLVAVIQAINKSHGVFTHSDEKLMRTLGRQIGIMLNHSQVLATMRKQSTARFDLCQFAVNSGSCQDEVTLSKLVAEMGAKVLSSSRCNFWVHEPHQNSLWTLDKDARISRVVITDISVKVVGKVALSGETIMQLFTSEDPGVTMDHAIEDDCGEGKSSRMGEMFSACLIGQPVFSRSDRSVLLGVIECANKRGGVYDEDDKKVIEVFAFMTSVALERLRGGESAGHESMTQ